MNPSPDPAAVEAAVMTMHAALVGLARVLGVGLPGMPAPGKERLPVRILAALATATRPLRGKLLARAAGHKPDANFRRVVAGLKREGLVVRVPHRGYWSATRPVPGLQPDQ